MIFIRKLIVFPFELLLMLIVGVHIATEFLGFALGSLCNFIEGGP